MSSQPINRLDRAVTRAQQQAQGRSIWWFVALAVAVAFIPVSAPVTILLYVFLVVICWVPMVRAIRSGFRQGRRN